jgi:hypothetical protein
LEQTQRAQLLELMDVMSAQTTHHSRTTRPRALRHL